MSASRIVQTALGEGRSNLLEPEALELCRLYEIPASEWRFAESGRDAEVMAKELGFPVVMKIVTEKPLDKSEVGGVELGLRNSREVKARFKRLVEIFKTQKKSLVLGVLLQKQVEPQLEVIMGSMRDPQFGPCVMMGLGGEMAEISPEATFRMLPLADSDSLSMLTEIADGRFLSRLQTRFPAAREMLIRSLSGISKMMTELNDLNALELNPLALNEDQAVLVGAKGFLRKANR